MTQPPGFERFEVAVPEAVLDDLKARLSRTRWMLILVSVMAVGKRV